MDLEILILSALLYDQVYARKVISFLKQEYFTTSGTKNIFSIIDIHFNKYNTVPTVEVIAIEAAKLPNITAPLAKDIELNLNKLGKSTYSLDWLIDASEKWCQERAVYLAIVESIEIQDGTTTNKSIGAIPDILSKALAVSFDTNVGMNYNNSAEERFDYYNTVDDDKIKFGLTKLDEITNNGFARKTLNLVVASACVGKQQPISEPVLTPLGWSTMGDLRPGDYVIGSSGLPIKVLSIHPQGVKDVYTVKTMDGVYIRCGKEHLWSVYASSRRKDDNEGAGTSKGISRPCLFTYTTQELIDKGVIKTDGDPRFTLPKFDGLQKGISVSFGYALGYCLGNGGFSGFQLTVSYDDRIQDKLLSLLEPSLSVPTNSRINGGHSGQSGYSWSNINPEIAKYRDSGLSHDKKLHKDHSDWLLWDYRSRLELLQGLLDSDGSMSTKKGNSCVSSFCSTSINLIILVRDLVRSLGGRACEPIAENHTHYKSGNCWNLAFRMPVCPFKLHASKWKLSKYSTQSTITDITKEEYQEEQVCITVDAEDQLYVTTGFKLTHNSIMLCHHAAQCLTQGKNVLFITLEMSAEAIAQRIDANLLDTEIHTLYGNKPTYLNKFKQLQQKTLGELYIKEYPISTAHAGHFSALMDELFIKKQFVPDILIIDYLNICTSSTNTSNSNSYDRVKCIGEQLRSLAQKKNIPIFSAIQLNRSGSGNNDPDMSNIADSYGLAMVADFIVALIANESLTEMDQIMCSQIKNRYSGMDKNKKFVLKLEKSKMKFFDAENSEYMGDNEKSGYIDVSPHEVKLKVLNKNKPTISLSSFDNK